MGQIGGQTDALAASAGRAMARRLTSTVAICALAFGTLIWAKLRLVSGLPRTVYAEPRALAENRPSDLTPMVPGSGSLQPSSQADAGAVVRNDPAIEPARTGLASGAPGIGAASDSGHD